VITAMATGSAWVCAVIQAAAANDGPLPSQSAYAHRIRVGISGPGVPRTTDMRIGHPENTY
jgi:hypothetical protein